MDFQIGTSYIAFGSEIVSVWRCVNVSDNTAVLKRQKLKVIHDDFVQPSSRIEHVEILNDVLENQKKIAKTIGKGPFETAGVDDAGVMYDVIHPGKFFLVGTPCRTIVLGEFGEIWSFPASYATGKTYPTFDAKNFG